MIRVTRCAEPALLGPIRKAQLARLRSLGRAPSSIEISGYSVVAEDLWNSQHHKCCYCELRIPRGYNDVEHYRPKAAADRRPGCYDTHGYWWLAFTWDNLLFACPACNRSGKNSKFPLNAGAVALDAEDLPPGKERPLLLDPGSAINPVEHIEFVYVAAGVGGALQWWARPRGGSLLGNATIEVCDLNRGELRELRQDHFTDVVEPHLSALRLEINRADLSRVDREFRRALDLLRPRNSFVGLTFDALRAGIPDKVIRGILGKGWPDPAAI